MPDRIPDEGELAKRKHKSPRSIKAHRDRLLKAKATTPINPVAIPPDETQRARAVRGLGPVTAYWYSYRQFEIYAVTASSANCTCASNQGRATCFRILFATRC
jgi:hypothetical protein